MPIGSLFFGLLAAGFFQANAQQPSPSPQPMKCETGPVSRIFGGTEWIVYSCDDQVSMVVISAKGNPALPFVFFLMPNDGSYEVSGEGNGDKKASDAAGDEISKLTPPELTMLLASTKVR